MGPQELRVVTGKAGRCQNDVTKSPHNATNLLQDCWWFLHDTAVTAIVALGKTFEAVTYGVTRVRYDFAQAITCVCQHDI